MFSHFSTFSHGSLPPRSWFFTMLLLSKPFAVSLMILPLFFSSPLNCIKSNEAKQRRSDINNKPCLSHARSGRFQESSPSLMFRIFCSQTKNILPTSSPQQHYNIWSRNGQSVVRSVVDKVKPKVQLKIATRWNKSAKIFGKIITDVNWINFEVKIELESFGIVILAYFATTKQKREERRKKGWKL